MTTNQTDIPTSQRLLRLWPGVAAAVLLCLIKFGVPLVIPDAAMPAFIGSVVCGLAIMVWWLFFSRAAWPDRIGAIALTMVALTVTKFFVHPSIAGAGMGMLLYFFAIPVVSVALVLAVVVSQRWSAGLRRAVTSIAILLACAAFTLIRTGGISGEGGSDFHWRWTPTAEERLLAQAQNEKDPVVVAPVATPSVTPTATPIAAPTLATAATPAVSAPTSKADWPGFRGAERDSVVRGVKINTDWTQTPPVQLWRKPIGPGWSSFAVNGERIYTQEQRGQDEMVSAYNLNTGEPVWRHRDAARFYESNAGAGPRATPTLSNGRVYTLGATGILNALDERTGAVVWTRNAPTDTKKKVPDWGIAGSPLVVGDLVIAATAGSLAAYEATTGNPRWVGTEGGGGGGYSSPQLATIGGVTQILLLNSGGAMGVAPLDGKLLWQHEWKGDGIVQPYVIGGSDVLLGSGSSLAAVGLRRISVTRGADNWNVAERWTTNFLKPYYSDYVVHKGHAFGFDGSILACVDLADG
ncbi:MAG: PQQ-binding-like beta-propeller repeat protein, partial [Acidobacteria bacterium]|nr:PQQ-binding-like beta-propeller repeat protein [Acidobacteriota bacterium]